MPGRPPKPTAIHLLQGTAQKCRMDKRKGEIQLDPGMPDAPKWLLPEGLVEWGRITSISKYSKVLTAADRAMLTMYCVLWAEMVKHGEAGTEMGTSRMQAFIALAAKLGLNPADRVKVRMPNEEKPQNKFAKLGG